MINQDVIDLYGRLQGGEKVIVLTASGEMPKGLYIPKPPAPKKAAAPAAPAMPANAVPALKVLPPPSIALGTAPVVEAATPAIAPAVAPAAAPAPAEAPAATDAPICATALVNGVCPPAAND
jgi:hypothetical protein